MGHDPFSPFATAQVNVLCIPAGRVTQDRFQSFVQKLQETAVVNLEDLQLQPGTEQDIVSPSKSRFGAIVYNVSTTRTVGSESPLLFTPNEQPQVVFGLFDGTSLAKSIVHDSPNGAHGPSVSVTSAIEAAITDLDESLVKLAFPWLRKLVVFGIEPLTLDKGEVLFVADPQEDASYLAIMEAVSHDLLHVTQQKILDLRSDSLADPPTDKVLNGAANIIRQLTRSTNETNTSLHTEPTSAKTPVPSPNTVATQVQEAMSKARFSVIAGMLALQIGSWNDALRLLGDGANICRSLNDSLWLARSIEAAMACMLMFVWTGYDFSIPAACRPTEDRFGPWKLFRTNSYGGGSNLATGMNNHQKTKSQTPAEILISMLPGMIDMTLTCYTAAFNAGKYKVSRALLYEARVRSINLLVFLQIQQGSPDRASIGDFLRKTNYSLGHESDAVSAYYPFRKSELIRMLVDSLPSDQLDLPVSKSVEIVSAICTSLSLLGMERKYAFYMRRMLSLLTSALDEAKRKGASEMGVHPSVGIPHISMISSSSTDNSQSDIRPLLNVAAAVYGDPFHVVPPKPECITADSEVIKWALASWYRDQAAGDVYLKLDMLRECISASEAASDVLYELTLISYLLRTARQTITISSSQPNLPPCLSSDEQSRQLSNLTRAVSTGTRFGLHSARAPYWDDFMVRDIDVFESDPNTKLTSHAPRDLSVVEGSDETALTDPFIYNPFAKPSTKQEIPVLVCQEVATFTVTLQNTLEVDIEIDSISLLTEGCDFEPLQHNIVLGHLCSQSFILTGRPRVAGTLKILGCKASIRNCQEQEFLLFRDNWKSPENMKGKSTRIQKTRTHQNGVEADRAAIKALPEIKLPQNEILTVTVIDQLPKLQVAELSVSQPSLMLLEGEMKTVELTLRNESPDIQADFVLFTFEDSISTRLQEILNNKDLHPTETYEIQHQLYTNAAIKATDDRTYRRSRDIHPHSESKFSFQIFGRAGLNEVSIQTDYTRLGAPRSEVKETFYTRQLRFPIDVTVNGSVEVQRCNIVPVNADFSWAMERQAGTHSSEGNRGSFEDYKDTSHLAQLATVLRADNKHDDFCMLLVDLRNIWPYPLDIKLQTRQPQTRDDMSSEAWENAYTIEDTLKPGHVTRLVLLVPRILVADPFAAIPSLATQRQFVVSTNKLTPEVEASTRESFWYREQLLKNIRGTWFDQETHRTGEVDFRRGVRLTARMIDALRVDHVEISFSLEALPDSTQAPDDTSHINTVEQVGGYHFRMSVESFARLKVRVHNRGHERLHLLLRLQPSLRNQPFSVALDLSNRFVWTGLLQQALHPALEPDSVVEANLGIIALIEGQFEVNASVEEIQGPRKEKSPDLGMLRSQRRIWHARSACHIDAVERSR